MGAEGIEEQLTKYLTDVHAIEMQALAQMRAAPDIAGEPQLEEIFRHHLGETEEQERLVRERLEARDASPSRVKDVAGAASGKAFVLFARSQPDTPGKLTAHAFSYEHMELAAYELLRGVAERAGDPATVGLAGRIANEERAMADRLAASFDRAVDASLAAVEPDDLEEQLVKYLADAHAIEAQALELLSKSPKIAAQPELARVYEEHVEETREQQRLVTARLDAHGGSPSKIQDAVMRLGALNWGGFFTAQPDTPAKLAGFSFAFEHLEIGGYELLKRVAERAGDGETVAAAERILAEERAMAARVESLFEPALEASLEAQGAAR